MENGIAGLEMKPAGKGTNRAFRAGVKTDREVFSFLFFRFIFGGKSWRASRETP